MLRIFEHKFLVCLYFDINCNRNIWDMRRTTVFNGRTGNSVSTTTLPALLKRPPHKISYCFVFVAKGWASNFRPHLFAIDSLFSPHLSWQLFYKHLTSTIYSHCIPNFFFPILTESTEAPSPFFATSFKFQIFCHQSSVIVFTPELYISNKHKNEKKRNSDVYKWIWIP